MIKRREKKKDGPYNAKGQQGKRLDLPLKFAHSLGVKQKNKVRIIKKFKNINKKKSRHSQPRHRPARLFYIKISKSGLKYWLSLKKAKPRLRLFQCALFVFAWSKDGSRPLGTVYTYGRSKGRLCYDKTLKIGICRFMGIKHKQAVRYLREMEKSQWIVKQYTLDKKLEYRLNLPKKQIMATHPAEKYFTFNLSGAGKKGFDIFSMLETALAKDSHPAERDKNQLSFAIPARTRRWRKARHSKIKTKPIHNPHPDDRQKATPIKENNPFIQNKTTPVRKKSYEGWFYFILTQKDKYKIPWHSVRRLSEHQKVTFGIPTHCRAVWWKGQAFEWDSYSQGYKLVPKKSAKSDPSSHKPLESHEKIPRQKVTPVSRPVWTLADFSRATSFAKRIGVRPPARQ